MATPDAVTVYDLSVLLVKWTRGGRTDERQNGLNGRPETGAAGKVVLYWLTADQQHKGNEQRQ